MSKTKVTPEQFKAELELQDRFATIFRTNGWDPVADKNVDINDALDIQNAAFMIPKAMTTIVQEGIEPMLIGTHLLQKIQYKPGMMTVFPAVEPLRAEETGDGMDLPIYNINIGGAQSFGVTVKRHGLRLKIAKRFVEESAYPWINFWLRLAGNALARHKEEYIFDFITKLGTLVFDNDPNSRLASSPLQPIKGVTTGRNYKGVLNGSMTVDDVFDMYAAVLLNGFVPDTLLVHPMAWLMWVKDPVLREFAIQAGGGSFFANFTGNPAVLGNPFYNNRRTRHRPRPDRAVQQRSPYWRRSVAGDFRQLPADDVGPDPAELPRHSVPDPGQPVRELQSRAAHDRHHDVQQPQPWRPDRG